MRISRWFAVLGLLATSSCGSDALGVGDVAGAYVATTYTFAPFGQSSVDIVAGGGSLAIDLAADGSTSGQLSIPASLNGGTPFTANMAGTFALLGDTLSFDQAADTFVRDMPFVVSGHTLHGVLQVGSNLATAVITVTLTRQ